MYVSVSRSRASESPTSVLTWTFHYDPHRDVRSASREKRLIVYKLSLGITSLLDRFTRGSLFWLRKLIVHCSVSLGLGHSGTRGLGERRVCDEG